MDWKKMLTAEQETIVKTIESKKADYFIRYDMGELTDKEYLLFFLYLINTGLVWKFEGKFARQAMRLVGDNFLSLSFDTIKFRQAISTLNVCEKLLIRIDPKGAVKLWKKEKLAIEKILLLLEHLNRSGKHLWKDDAIAERAIVTGLRQQYFFAVPNFKKLNDGGWL